MNYQIKELLNLQNFIVSSKNCKVNKDECIIDPKLGKVIFDLEDMADKVVIHCKKNSGNGKLLVNNEEVTVLSKLSYQYELLTPSDKVEITRPTDSLGTVSIQGVSLYYKLDESDDLMSNWKKLITRCGEYKNLRIINEKLFASIGSFIDNESVITDIETLPSNSYTREDGKMKFSSACEITKLVIDKSAPAKTTSSFNFYEHRTASQPIITNSTIEAPIPVAKPAGVSLPVSSPQIKQFVYDSNTVNEFSPAKRPSTKNVIFLKSNGKDYLVLKPGGSYSVPISGLQSHYNYVVVIHAKKNGGAGRLQLAFTHNLKPNRNDVVVSIESGMSDTFTQVNTGTAPILGDTYKLTISMPDVAVGEILFSRIQIVNGISNVQSIEKSTESHSSTIPFLSASIKISDDDPITSSSKTFSLLPNDVYETDHTFEVTGVIQANDFSSAQWISKILPLFPNIKTTKSLNLLNNNRNAHEYPDVVMGSIGNLRSCNRLWIEEFQNGNLSDRDREVIDTCTVIMSPSLPNVQFFRQEFKNKHVIQVPKIWPYFNVEAHPGDYVLYFEKDQRLTNLLLQIWDPSFPKLYVVGTKVALPEYAKALSPYLPYVNILSYISGARVLIDLNINNHYFSGIGDLAHSMGVNVVTNNQWLHFAKPAPDCCSTNQIVNDAILPEPNSLKICLVTALGRSVTKNNLINYNLNIDATIRTLVGSDL